MSEPAASVDISGFLKETNLLSSRLEEKEDEELLEEVKEAGEEIAKLCKSEDPYPEVREEALERFIEGLHSLCRYLIAHEVSEYSHALSLDNDIDGHFERLSSSLEELSSGFEAEKAAKATGTYLNCILLFGFYKEELEQFHKEYLESLVD